LADTEAAITSGLTSTEKALKSRVDETKAIAEAAMKSEILNTESAVRTGDTLTIRYRTYSGLAPTIDVYNAANALEVNKGVMKEIGTTGVYEYDVTFDSSWGMGDYSILCSETTKGTLDALAISVITTDLDQVASQVASILGTTAGLEDIADVAESMRSQFAVIETVLSKMTKDIVNQVKEAASSVTAFDSVFNQLSSISEQVKQMAGETTVNLSKLYEVSSEKKEDMVYLKNKTQELKAAMSLSKKMIENIANKPVTETWYEYK
jgi:hypothetical protein